MQKHQNIYDNETFFESYKELREKGDNYNTLLEQPSMTALLPDVTNKNVLDLGCGYGANSFDFIKRGAHSVVGVDISLKMLEVAKQENSNDKILYLNMSMTDIDTLNCSFDLIYSSLAFHYIEDFDGFCKKMYSVLNYGGTLLFSQEHPLVTATFKGKQHYNKDENGEYSTFTFSNYGQPGKRDSFWFVDGVEKYHRRFSDIINALVGTGFTIKKVCEPLPSVEATEKQPLINKKELIKPTFLIVKAEKI